MRRREFLAKIASAGALLAGAPVMDSLFVPFAEAKAVPSFSFAHITDLHLDVKGTSNWQYRERSVPLFIDTLRQVGRLPQLDFVIFGGDQIHAGPNDRDSLYVFQEWTKHLGVPYYILLGNMEVSPVPGASRLSRAEYLSAWRGHGPGAGRSSWTFDPVRGVQVIGFDVTVDGKPYGLATQDDLKWLEETLDASRDRRLVIIVTHQLLLPTAPPDLTPEWSLFMVRNHWLVRELIEHYTNVRLVISGHHHVSKVETLNNVTYVADPAVVTYPCAFRHYTVSREGIHLKNIGLSERNMVNRARDLLAADPYARLYDPVNPQNILAYHTGLTEQDRQTTIPL
jgi:3',5'-cyclic AMP phosphodiesterase CpdA